MLDVLSGLHALTPRYRTLLRRGADQLGQFGRVMEFRSQVTQAFTKALFDYCAYVESHAQPTARRDGTILPLAVETLVVLRSLAEYKDILSTLPRDAIVPEKVSQLVPRHRNEYWDVCSRHDLNSSLFYSAFFFTP